MRIVIFSLLIACSLHAQRQNISLDGTWQFQTDPSRKGEAQRWQDAAQPFNKQIVVPGCWQASGVGEPNAYLRHDYLGHAWYKRGVAIPADWRDKQVWLKISGASRTVTAYVNGDLVGDHDGFSAPFRFNISPLIKPGQENTIAFLVDNTAGSNTQLPQTEHDYSRPIGAFNYMGNWGGIYGHVSLEETGAVWVDQVFVRTKIAPAQSSFDLDLGSRPELAGHSIAVKIQIRPRGSQSVLYDSESKPYVLNAKSALQTSVPMPGAQLWSPENPALYVATVQIFDSQHLVDSIQQTFGVREFSVAGSHILLNGHPYYLVGFGDLSAEVITGTPSVSLEENLRRVKIAKDFGFNYVRLHSRVPPEEFFEAADRLGLLVQAELPVFYSNYLLSFRQFAWHEMQEAFPAFRNHPSFFSSALGNELHPLPGKHDDFFAAFAEFYRRAKQLNPDGLAMGTDGFPYLPADFFSVAEGYVPGKPAIGHEFGGWMCSLPDLSLAKQFTGVIEPYWMTETEKWLKENNLLEVYPDLLKGSQEMLTELRKFRVEKMRRMPWMSGYQLWLINDYPSGSPEGYIWEEGILDYFWRPKAATAEQYRQFNNLNVLLIDNDFSKRTWWEGATYKVRVSSSWYSERAPKNPRLTYKLTTYGKVLASGHQAVSIHAGQVSPIAELEIAVPKLGRAAPCQLHVTVEDEANISVENTWRFWIYPQKRLDSSPVPVISRLANAHIHDLYPFIKDGGDAHPGELVLTEMLDPRDISEVLAGSSEIVFLQPNREFGEVPLDFFPVFTGKPHAYGSRIEHHALFHNFPNDGYFDAQFYSLAEASMGLPVGGLLSPVPDNLHPLVWCVWSSGDTPPGLHHLAFLYEFRAGKGKVIVTSLNFIQSLNRAQPSAMYLFDQLLRYASSGSFSPEGQLTEEEFSRLLIGIKG